MNIRQGYNCCFRSILDPSAPLGVSACPFLGSLKKFHPAMHVHFAENLDVCVAANFPFSLSECAGQNTLQQGQTDGITSRLTPVMTIMGLLCSPDVARRAQLGELGLDTSQPLQVDRLNAAYGLIAQVVVFLGVILDTPPLFHIVLDGSSCSIQQYIPRFSKHGTVEPEHSEVRSSLPASPLRLDPKLSILLDWLLLFRHTPFCLARHLQCSITRMPV